MPLACLVYIAKIDSQSEQILLLRHKDTYTRLNAHTQISGVAMTAGGYHFEIVEGEYAKLEAYLDQIAESGLIEDPEILIFSLLKSRQFKSWTMGVLESRTPLSEDLSVLRMLGTQAQSDPSSTPRAALTMLREFNDQFAREDLGHRAA